MNGRGGERGLAIPGDGAGGPGILEHGIPGLGRHISESNLILGAPQPNPAPIRKQNAAAPSGLKAPPPPKESWIEAYKYSESTKFLRSLESGIEPEELSGLAAHEDYQPKKTKKKKSEAVPKTRALPPPVHDDAFFAALRENLSRRTSNDSATSWPSVTEARAQGDLVLASRDVSGNVTVQDFHPGNGSVYSSPQSHSVNPVPASMRAFQPLLPAHAQNASKAELEQRVHVLSKEPKPRDSQPIMLPWAAQMAQLRSQHGSTESGWTFESTSRHIATKQNADSLNSSTAGTGSVIGGAGRGGFGWPGAAEIEAKEAKERLEREKAERERKKREAEKPKPLPPPERGVNYPAYHDPLKGLKGWVGASEDDDDSGSEAASNASSHKLMASLKKREEDEIAARRGVL